MSAILHANSRVAYHQVGATVDRARLISELRQLILSISSPDRRLQQLRKDVQQGKNKVADTLAAFLAAGPSSKAIAFGQRIIDVVSAGTRQVRRKLRDLSPIETKEEGEFNCLQNKIDLGDYSTQTLTEFVKELDEYIPVVQEMRAAAIDELYAPKMAQSRRSAGT